MQKERIGVSLPGSVESPPLEVVVVLVDSADVALGVQRTFSVRVRGVCDGGSGLIASECVEIPVVGSNGEVSGILCHTRARSDTRGAVAPHRRERVRAISPTRRPASHQKNLRRLAGDRGVAAASPSSRPKRTAAKTFCRFGASKSSALTQNGYRLLVASPPALHDGNG